MIKINNFRKVKTVGVLRFLVPIPPLQLHEATIAQPRPECNRKNGNASGACSRDFTS